jgi:hypothetical protein
MGLKGGVMMGGNQPDLRDHAQAHSDVQLLGIAESPFRSDPGALIPLPEDATAIPVEADARGIEAEDNRSTSADFLGGIHVQIRQEGSCWLISSKRRRRRDFASPYLDHSRRTAEFWYGTPISGWHEPPPAKERKSRKPAKRVGGYLHCSPASLKHPPPCFSAPGTAEFHVF